MDNMSHSEDARAFIIVLELELPAVHAAFIPWPCEKLGCVVFQSYFGYDIESSFKVWGCESTFSGLN